MAILMKKEIRPKKKPMTVWTTELSLIREVIEVIDAEDNVLDLRKCGTGGNKGAEGGDRKTQLETHTHLCFGRLVVVVMMMVVVSSLLLPPFFVLLVAFLPPGDGVGPSYVRPFFVFSSFPISGVFAHTPTSTPSCSQPWVTCFVSLSLFFCHFFRSLCMCVYLRASERRRWSWRGEDLACMRVCVHRSRRQRQST